MDEQIILEKTEVIFREVFNNHNLIIKKGMTSNDVENWDSLSHMLLISEIENLFAIKFKLKELNKMHNVGDMIELIKLKLQ